MTTTIDKLLTAAVLENNNGVFKQITSEVLETISKSMGLIDSKSRNQSDEIKAKLEPFIKHHINVSDSNNRSEADDIVLKMGMSKNTKMLDVYCSLYMAHFNFDSIMKSLYNSLELLTAHSNYYSVALQSIKQNMVDGTIRILQDTYINPSNTPELQEILGSQYIPIGNGLNPYVNVLANIMTLEIELAIALNLIDEDKVIKVKYEEIPF